MSADDNKTESPADMEKKLGNEAFAKKEFDTAIKHYNKAIELDGNNATYYSNRSACFASLKKWTEALQDALKCVEKDPKFVKGFLRLATAQIELDLLEDAELTLKAALTLDMKNSMVGNLIRKLKDKKKAGSNEKKMGKHLDEEQRKELATLQEQQGVYSRDLNGVMARMGAIQREAAGVNNSSTQLEEFSEETPMFLSVGKTYIRHPKSRVKAQLESELDHLDKNFKDLKDRKEYLERRLTSNVAGIKDLTE
jgi:tetratricopeptide (TPR) repeat protein